MTHASSARPTAAHRLLGATAVAHLLLVAALLPLFHFVGERRAPVAILLYVPRALFGLPVLALAPALWRWGPRRLLWAPALATLLVLGPLMGFHLNFPSGDGPTLRLLTYNVYYGYIDPQAIAREVQAANPDIILFQAAAHPADVAIKNHPFESFHYLHEQSFAVASRYPIRVVKSGEPVPAWRGAGWVQFEVDSPFGPLELFSVHPLSPRSFFDRLRHGGLRKLAAGAPLDASGTFAFLEHQLVELDAASRDAGPLRILAGDFNTPEGSTFVAHLFPGTEDAFAAAGRGYGYTFPASRRWPEWLRLDRVLLGEGLEARSASTVGQGGSDHAPLLVEISPRLRAGSTTK
jgi:vancomycin resistance protein VanJ